MTGKRMAHTAAPWSIDENDLREDAQLILSDITGCPVAETFLQGREGECEANARLIRTAPDLLLVALRVVEWMRAVDDGGDDLEYLNRDGWDDMRETAEMARRAVSRARNEA